MKGVILAAGKGTRMGGLTQDLPKPMLLVRGRPILEHIIDGLIAAGIRDICIITGWRAEVIESHFGDGSHLGIRIAYARQEIQDGTGRAPVYARSFVGTDDFLLTYGDILVPPDTYAQMLARFREQDFSGVITVTVGEDVSKGGINIFDDAFCLRRLVEKPSADQIAELVAAGLVNAEGPFYYNAGIYVFRPEIYDVIGRLQRSPRGEYELTDAISMLVDSGRLMAGLKIAGRWVDVRDPHVLAALERGEM